MLSHLTSLLKLIMLNTLIMVTVVGSETVFEIIQSYFTHFPDWMNSKPPARSEVIQWPFKKTHDPHCHVQSPTDINTAHAVPQILEPLSVHLLFNMPESTVSFINTGYYLELKLPPNLEPKPYLIGGPLCDDKYVFEQAHFHWGRHNDCGSEHHVNGKCSAMELHAVWRNAKYDCFEDAAKFDDGVAVLAFFGELSQQDNPDFDELIKLISLIGEPESETTGAFHQELKFLEPLMKQNTYYSFPGSLTTAPYQECVSWIVCIDRPFEISGRQIDAFRELRDKDGTQMITENDRPLQEFGPRPIITPLFNRKLIVSDKNDHNK